LIWLLLAGLKGIGEESQKLAWRPPLLTAPSTISLEGLQPTGSGNVDLRLDPTRDYVVKLGSAGRPGELATGLALTGGRNVVIVGGRITCQDIVDSNLSRGRGIEIWDNKGTVHIEGVLFANCGTGIAISAPESVVQVQNSRFEDVDSPYDLMHPDVIQTWRGPKEIRIDGLTADFSSKGLLWMSVNGQFPRRVDQRRINFRLWSKGGATPNGPHHFTWHVSPTTRSTCQACWTETGWFRNAFPRRLQDGWGTFADASGATPFIPYRLVRGRTKVEVRSEAQHNALKGDLGRRQGDFMERLDPSLAGERWTWGIPPGGDFVPADRVGPGYISPGYR